MKYLLIIGALMFVLTGCDSGGFKSDTPSTEDSAGGLGDGNDSGNGPDSGNGSDDGGGNDSDSGNNNDGNTGGGGNNPGGGGNNPVDDGNQTGIIPGEPATPPGYPGGVTPKEPGTVSAGDTGNDNQGEPIKYPDLGTPEPPRPGQPGGGPGPGPEPNSDKVKPLIAFVQTPGSVTNQNFANFEVWVGDNEGGRGIDYTECSIDNGAFARCETTFDYQNLVDGGHVVVARTFDLDKNVSEPVAYSWFVDTKKPSVQITKQPDNPSSSGDAIFEFIGTDSGSGVDDYQCSIDGGAFQQCDSGQSYDNLPDGDHSFSVIAVDNAGNASEPVKVDWLIDSTIPTIQITKHPTNPSNVNTATFEFVGAGGGSGISGYQCSIDGAAYVFCSSPQNYSGLADGNHSFAVRAVGNTGNTSKPATYEWLIDTIKPLVQITQSPGAISNSPASHFEFVGTDAGSGVSGYQCSVDGGAYQVCGSPQDLNLADGNHVFAVIAVDNAGNVSDPAIHNWMIDAGKPLVQITKHPANPTNSNNAVFEFTGSDAVSGIKGYQCRLDSNSYQACSSPQSYVGIADGNHTFYVRAQDNAGSFSDPALYSWLVDTTAPVVQITKNPTNPSNSNAASFEFVGSDAGSGISGYQCRVNGGNFQSCTSAQAYTGLSDGNNNFSVRVLDNAGNLSADANYSWVIDTTKPTIQITKAPDTPTNNKDAVFEFVGSDSGTGIGEYQCSIDSGVFQACTSPDGYSQLIDGSHLFTVKVTDLAGNVSDPATHTWKIDTKGPEVVIVTRPDDLVHIGDDAEVEFTITDDSAVEDPKCTLNGQAIDCAPGEVIKVPAENVGDNTLVIVAEDEAGNTTEETITWETDYNYIAKLTDFTVNEDRPVDLLFVVDNSISMDNERANLAERIDGLISKVDGLDWQIAVISTDVENEINSKGKFVEMIGAAGTYILDSTMDVNQAQAIFGNTVQNFQGGGADGIGGGNEQGIWATKMAIDRYIANETQQKAFFRDNSDLSVVLLSDEDENSEGNGIQMTPQNFVNYVDQTWNSEKNLTWHSIITKPGDQACEDVQYHFAGDIYDELSRLTGFGQVGGAIIGSVCENDYTSQLADIGQSVKDRQSTIELTCNPSDRNNDGKPDISVEKDGTSYAGAYQLTGLKMVFTDLLPVGNYKVNYECIE